MLILIDKCNYEPTISIGAFDTETGEPVSYILNSLLENDAKTAYDILTGTIPNHRRQGIAKNISEKIKITLHQNGITLYKTEVLKTNPSALKLYISIGFTISNEVVKVINTPKGSREVYLPHLLLSLHAVL